MQCGPIAGNQLVQAKLAEMLTEITKAQLMALARRAPQGRRDMLHAHDGLDGQAQQRATWRSRSRATAATSSARNGIIDEYPVMRHM